MFEKIFCFSKVTTYEFNHLNEKARQKFLTLPSLMQKRITESHENHHHFLTKVKQEFQNNNLEVRYFSETDLDKVHPSNQDLVLSCGGDGMFLSCAQKFPHCKLMGMNSDFQIESPSLGSAGALTSVDIRNLEGFGKKLKNQEWKVSQWKRLAAKINEKSLDTFAVNDIYFGPKTGYLTCSARIQTEQIKGSFLSSGIIACTGMGSHAWFKTAGGTPFSNELNAFGFLILWANRNFNNSPTSYVFSDRNSLIIRPNRDGYILAFDSKANIVETLLDDKIEIYLDKYSPINVVEFLE